MLFAYYAWIAGFTYTPIGSEPEPEPEPVTRVSAGSSDNYLITHRITDGNGSGWDLGHRGKGGITPGLVQGTMESRDQPIGYLDGRVTFSRFSEFKYRFSHSASGYVMKYYF